MALILNANFNIKDVTPLIAYAECKMVIFGQTHDLKGSPEETERVARAFDLDMKRWLLGYECKQG